MSAALGVLVLLVALTIIGNALPKPTNTVASTFATTTAPPSSAPRTQETTTPAPPVSTTSSPEPTTTDAPPSTTDAPAFTTTPATAPQSTEVPPSIAVADPSRECFARPPSTGDVLFRTLDPGVGWTAQRLGGGFVYNHTVNECQDSVMFLLAVVPTGAGYCGQVALASDNPTYDENATPAPPLKKVIAAAGANCG